jgi:hypothetical protein
VNHNIRCSVQNCSAFLEAETLPNEWLGGQIRDRDLDWGSKARGVRTPQWRDRWGSAMRCDDEGIPELGFSVVGAVAGSNIEVVQGGGGVVGVVDGAGMPKKKEVRRRQSARCTT